MMKIRQRRKGGLFKTEFKANTSGARIIALCSKTYFAWDGDNVEKISAKGVQNRLNAAMLTVLNFQRVLDTQVSEIAVNKGFRLKEAEMYTYTQSKVGLSYLYIKRIVLSDGIHTKPLEI
jgi:hypothetical protein